jgi:HupE/UreJ protein
MAVPSFFLIKPGLPMSNRRLSAKAGRKTAKAGMMLMTLMTLSCWQTASAHVVVGELEKMSGTDAAALYVRLGYTHILPFGLDHILFVLSLFLLSPRLKPVLWQATAFTVAHSVTLGLAMYQLITPPARIVEPLIALSIVYVALENIFSPRLKPSRVGVVFLFGLVHGLGFAGALGQLGLPQSAYLLSLVMFNLGVELGQLTIILAAWFLVGKWFGSRPYYRRWIVKPSSLAIAGVAAFWTIQRIFF